MPSLIVQTCIAFVTCLLMASCNKKMTFSTKAQPETIRGIPQCMALSGFEKESVVVNCSSAEASSGRILKTEIETLDATCSDVVSIQNDKVTFTDKSGECRVRASQCTTKSCGEWGPEFKIVAYGKRCDDTSVNLSLSAGNLGFTYLGTTYDVVATASHLSGACAISFSKTPVFPLGLSFKGGSFPGTGGSCLSELSPNATCTMTLQWSPTLPGAVVNSFKVGYTATKLSAEAAAEFSTRVVKRQLLGLSREGPTFSREPLSSAGFSGGNPFGTSVSVFGDLMVVGGDGNTTDANGENYLPSAGAAFVYERLAGTWSFKQKLFPTGTNGRNAADYFGKSVATSADTIVVGAPSHGYDENGQNYVAAAGAAFVFKKTNNTWVQVQKIVGVGTGGRDASASFGTTIAISGDTIAVGSPGHKLDASGLNSMNSAGTVFVYSRASSSASFAFQQKIVPSGTNSRVANDTFGSALSLDSDSLAVGVYSHKYDESGVDDGKTYTGAVFVFTRSSGVWSQQAKLVGSTGVATNGRNSSDYYGQSVAISGDSLAVGAPNQDYDEAGGGAAVANSGAVFIYSRSGATWSFQQKIIATGTNARVTSDNFGVKVSLSGSLLAVGVPYQDYDEVGNAQAYTAGAVFTFLNTAGVWSQEQKIIPSGTNARNASDSFGGAISLHGSTLASTAYFNSYDENGANYIAGTGAAFVLLRSGVTWSQQAKVVGTQSKVSFIGDIGFGISTAVYGDTMVVSAHKDPLDENSSNYSNTSGNAYVFVRSNNVWVFQQKLVLPSLHRGLNTYCSAGNVYSSGPGVAIDGDTIVIGCPNDTKNVDGSNFGTETGAAYVFVRTNGTWSFQQKLIAFGLNARTCCEKFGAVLGISGDTIVVTARYSHYNEVGAVSVNNGVAYVFKRTGTTWADEARLGPSGTNAAGGFNFGSTVAIHGDELAIGSTNGYDADGANPLSTAGTVFVFKRTGSAWAQTQRIVPTGTNARTISGFFGSQFGGTSLAMNGSLLVVSSANSYNEDGSSNADGGSGAVFVFEKSNGQWVQTKKIVAPGDRSKKLGFGKGIALDASTIVVASPNDALDENEQNELTGAGAAYVYQKSGGAWSLVKKLTMHGDNRRVASDSFGRSVAVSSGRIFVSSAATGFADNGSFVPWAGAISVWEGLVDP